MRDENHLNELLDHLQTVRLMLRAKKLFAGADTVDEAATQLRILFDETGDLRIRIRELETENDALRDDIYYWQDRFEDERAETDTWREMADELQLRLSEARAIESGLRADLKGMSR